MVYAQGHSGHHRDATVGVERRSRDAQGREQLHQELTSKRGFYVLSRVVTKTWRKRQWARTILTSYNGELKALLMN